VFAERMVSWWLTAPLSELHDVPNEVAASFVLLMIRDAARGRTDLDFGFGEVVYRSIRAAIGRRHLVLSAHEAAWAAATAARLPDLQVKGLLMIAAAALAGWCKQPDDPGLRSAAAALAAAAGSQQILDHDRVQIRKHLSALVPPPAAGPLDLSIIEADDGWSRAVRQQAAGFEGDCGAANLLLAHLGITWDSKPSKAWLTGLTPLVRDPGAARLLRILVEAAVTAELVQGVWHGWPRLLLVDVDRVNQELLRAACWAAGTLDEDWVVPALHALAHRGLTNVTAGGMVWHLSVRVTNACIYSLGMIATEPAMVALYELQRTVTHAGCRKQIDAAITAAAARTGLSASALAERVTPYAGLSSNAERIVTASVATARVTISGDCRVVTDWRTTAGWARKPPALASPDDGRLVKDAVKEVKAALAGERSRLESLLAEERTWTLADWRRFYLGHPVTGRLARSLIWSFDTGNGIEETAMPAGGQRLHTLAGRRPGPAEATVRLWHPARAATAEVRGWRDHLVTAGLRQPFKQAFREVYVLTPAELETRLYSNRFAAHILNYRQAYALLKRRGWTAGYIGPYEGGDEAQARRDFPAADLTAIFGYYLAEAGFGELSTLCGTDRVTFCRSRDRRRAPVPLAEVPGLVFSEAMRDVDLVVSVTSIAVDPLWADRDGDPHFAYWQQHSTGDLTQVSEVRREALARLLPKLKIGSQLELTGRHLRVTGKLNTYKIHIGSGGVQIEPDDRYLCIVPASTRTSVMLPFDDDQILSIIVSKAVLLAADDKITDPAIIEQLGPR
jgi:hypothetical protein